MKINWLTIIIAALPVLALLIFLFRANRKDRKQLEDQLNKDFPRKKEKHFEEEDPDDLKGG